MRAPVKRRQPRSNAKRAQPRGGPSTGGHKKTYVIEDTFTHHDGLVRSRWLVAVIDKKGQLAGTLGYDDENEARCVCVILGGG